MTDLLALIYERLRDPVARVGFVGDGPSDHDVEGGRVVLLEFRRDTPGRLKLLLDVIALAGTHVIAELWSPSAPTQPSAACSADDVAVRRRIWTVDPTVDPEVLATEVAAEVAAWLEHIELVSPDS